MIFVPCRDGVSYVVFSVELFPIPNPILSLETYLESLNSLDVSQSSLVFPISEILTLKS